MIDNHKLQIGKTIQKFETLQDYQAQSTFDGRDRLIIEFDIANILEEGNDFMVDSAEEVHNEQAGDGEVIGSERMGNGDTEFEILNLEAEGYLEDSLTKYLEIELLLMKAIIGASVFSVIVAFLVWGFHHKRMKASVKDSCLFARPCFESLVVDMEKTIGKDSSMTPKPSLISKPRIESVIAEKHSSVLCNREEMHMERFGSFVSYSSFHAVEESLKGNNESRAPTIELLGEFVFGEVSSSQSWAMKNWRIESEESEYYVSTKSRNKVHSDPVQPQPALSELSTMDSHSCARYTSGKKIVKEKGGKDGEAHVITNSARRSSRIHNRPVMSP
ncbi:hypothetical protein I3760_01G227200 [Carya illinoinensis]|nr:hypothetical protein I3760_01G227200 [Carya illinoinensis]